MESRESVEPTHRSAPRTDTVLLVALGFLLVAGGVALVVAPGYWPEAQQVADTLASVAGVQSGVLILGGLVFVSLGIFSRRLTRLAAAAQSNRAESEEAKFEDSVDVPLVVEQLVADMGQLRSTLAQVLGECGRSSESVRRLVEMQEAQAESAAGVPSPGQPQHDAPMFVLASSLDKLNARLDARLIALTERIDERLAQVRETPRPDAREDASVVHASTPDTVGGGPSESVALEAPEPRSCLPASPHVIDLDAELAKESTPGDEWKGL